MAGVHRISHGSLASRIQREATQEYRFWVFLFSNMLWVVWALHTSATALVALQVCLAVLNVRGLFKTDPPT